MWRGKFNDHNFYGEFDDLMFTREMKLSCGVHVCDEVTIVAQLIQRIALRHRCRRMGMNGWSEG